MRQLPRLIDVAREKGVAAYVGDGTNRWPAVHRLDAARLFRLALESAPAGTGLHGAADEGIPFKGIAAAIGSGLGVPLKSIPAEEAQAHFGWLGMAAAVDNATSSERTRNILGWKPEQPGLIEDLEVGHYFGGRRTTMSAVTSSSLVRMSTVIVRIRDQSSKCV
ncbi:hypothetical protein ACWCQR_25500, partial [Streptomyces sp. NPDC002172]